MSTELHDLSIAELSGLIAARKLSPVQLVEALIRRLEEYDEQTHAVITRTFDLARRQAREAEADISTTPVPSCSGSWPLTRWRMRVPRSICPGLLRGTPGTSRISRGSSSGSGAAVGMVPLALGSDTGGSIRGPASLCWVVGLMPTFGLVSRAGVIPNSYTFDHCGPLARTVEDCALALEVLAGYDSKDAGSLRRPIPPYRQALGQDLRGLKIGVLRHHWEEDVPASEDVCKAMEIALDVLRRLGAELGECRVRPLASYFDVEMIIAESEIFSVHQKNLIAPRTSAPTSDHACCRPCSSPPTTTSRPRASIAG